MKKLIPIIAITVLAVGIISWRAETYSATSLPYPKPADCTEATVNEMYLMKKDWNLNLQSLLEQEKPTSKMVDEAFEGLRTYRCWLDYLCEAVLFSANVKDTKVMIGSQLTDKHIDRLPGCVSIDFITINATKLKYMPECQVAKKGSSVNEVLKQANQNYSTCRQLVGLEFGDPSSVTGGKDDVTKKYIEAFKNQSAAYIGLERALKTNSASQKGRVLRNKLSGILNQMHAMEAHVTYLREYMEKFDALLPCFAAKCD